MKNCNSCPTGQIPYRIRSGDTLWAIAQSYATSVDEIQKANPNISADNLRPGELICIPFTGGEYPSCRTGNYYVVRKNTDISSIALYFGVTTKMLIQNNMGIDPQNLFEGQVLCIPVAPSPVRLEIQNGKIRVIHKDGGETSCLAQGGFFGESCIVNKQLDIGVSGARILNLSNSTAISGKSSNYGGIVVDDSDMDALFNLAPVGTLVIGRQ